MANTIEIKIIECKEITTKNGRKFTAYKTVGKGGRKMDVRFTKECTKTVKEPCTIVVDRTKANVDKTRLYPILWIKDIVEIKENVRKDNLDEFFGEDTENAEEI